MRQFQIAKTLEELEQGDLGFQAGERRADADVGAAAETPHAGDARADVEAVRVVETPPDRGWRRAGKG